MSNPKHPQHQPNQPHEPVIVPTPVPVPTPTPPPTVPGQTAPMKDVPPRLDPNAPHVG